MTNSYIIIPSPTKNIHDIQLMFPTLCETYKETIKQRFIKEEYCIFIPDDFNVLSKSNSHCFKLGG